MSSQPPSKRQKTGPAKRESRSTRLYNKLKLEGPPRKAETGRLVDRDDRLPEEASQLNLWADAYWNAGCRTMEEIAADEQAAASSAEQQNPTQGAPPPVEINVKYTHSHIHSSPFSQLSAGDISRNIRATEMFNIAGRSTEAVAGSGEEGENGLGAEIIVIPALGLRCTVAEIQAPPALSYTTENIGDLVRDWDSGTRLQIGGLPIPLKYWPDLYARHRGEIYSKRKEVWRQWRVSKNSS
jgi:hypothetical protein